MAGYDGRWWRSACLSSLPATNAKQGSDATKQSSFFVAKHGLLRGACHRAALCADPVARNDGLTRANARCLSPCGRGRIASRDAIRVRGGRIGTARVDPRPLPQGERELTAGAATSMNRRPTFPISYARPRFSIWITPPPCASVLSNRLKSRPFEGENK